MPPKAKKPVAVKKGKPKAKVKKEPPPPPPPPPPPDPRLLLVDELIPQYGLAQPPSDPLQSTPGYEGDLAPYPVPETYKYKTCRGIVVESPYYAGLGGSSEIYVPVEPVQVDVPGVRRCWNILRFHFEPVFGDENCSAPANRHSLHKMYRFLRHKGEKFGGGFPDDEAKWRPLWELMRLTFFVDGNDPDVAVVAAKSRAVSLPTADGVYERLWKALKDDDLEGVAKALHDKPDVVNLPHADEHFPLTYAAEHSDVNMVRLLLAAAAMPNAPGRLGWTALHYTCERGQLDSARLLLCYNADGAAANVYGESPLHYAASGGYEALVGLMGTQAGHAGRPTTHAQVTPLHLAAARGHVDVVRRLIELRADVRARDVRGYTAFVGASLRAPEVEVQLVAADVALGELLKEKKKKGKGGAKKGAKRR